METRPLSDLIAALRKGDGNGCRHANALMQEAADALMANQGAIVNSIIERTRTEATDDEREAQIPALIRELRMAQGDGSDWTEDLFARAADGLEVLLRRSGVPEPRATWVHCSPALLARGLSCASTVRRTCACEPVNGGHDHLVSEPQGKPSDTDLIAWHVEQVEALRPFIRSSAHLHAAMMHAATVRALRAAGGAR
ncbi:hypothetical protein QEH34_gp61 [Microbacterium phage Footloose]|uniref:Uncharacterized protein n=1 Tax=Microbacterium phage Footloose TaxID=2836048 RepID=A0A8F3E9I4_9CAUD|nr:hypothetical protein QEH34_gp61 [Microbacterium phage Footloose]QWY84641.1 hypothetical protein SEA_FOOTLOOSE_61 [Microbacterium phage Footloose]